MTKLLTALAFSVITSSAPALADSSLDSFQAQGYRSTWRFVDTGESTGGGYVYEPTAVCQHLVNCDCNGQNQCGNYKRGQKALYWVDGCENEPRQIVCDVRR